MWCTLVCPNSTSLVSPNLEAVESPNDFFFRGCNNYEFKFPFFICELHAFHRYEYTHIIYVSTGNLHGKSIFGPGFFQNLNF